MATGKTWLEHNSFTFFFRYRVKIGEKWVCTSYPRCPAFICVDQMYRILVGNCDHNHEQRTLHMCPNGQYVNIKFPKEREKNQLCIV